MSRRKRETNSAPFKPATYDLSIDEPLHIAFGRADCFSERILNAQIYNKAMIDLEARKLASEMPS